MSEPELPCDLVITHVWKENDSHKGKGFVTKYRVETSNGESIGEFVTPFSSRLSQELFRSARKFLP
jgi:hypothetical protein